MLHDGFIATHHRTEGDNMKLITVTKIAAGHYTLTTPAGLLTLTRTGRTWRLTSVAALFRTMRAALTAATSIRPTRPLGSMPGRLLKLIARTHRAARTVTKALAYRCRSGLIAVAVEQGQLIRTGDLLDRLGADDLPDGQRSWYGRHTAKAYRATHLGAHAVKVWTQHRTTGRWIHAFVYNPTEPALYTALRTYKATRHLVNNDFARCA
ncbi:hypothetical protein ACIOEX_01510 [Streptomyces sp. NPDC087850]|uniref:hypothetical protein n=1 Tax=Streptomyces sp. NPDC087850 TaxID=3365809 RepID=UPI003827B16F